MKRDVLRMRLREEGLAGVPEFSPLLHERVMVRVRAAEAPSAGRVGRRSWWPMAAAASVVIAGSLLAVGVYQTRRVARVVALPSPKDISEPVDRILTSAAAPAVQSMDEARYGYLDRVAKNFVTFLASQFPGTPEPDAAPRK